MALNRIVCPECGKAMNPARPFEEGQRVRCSGCQAAFVVQSEEAAEGEREPAPRCRPREGAPQDTGSRRRSRADRDEERDDLRPRRRGGRERGQPKKGGPLLPLLLVGGGVALLLVVGCGVGVYFLSQSGGPGRQTDATEADLAKIQQYATRAEVEAILGPGEPIEPAEYGILMGGGADWYGWRNADDCLLVAFQKGKTSGTPRVVGSAFVRRKVGANKVTFAPKFGIPPPVFGPVDVDAEVANRDARQAQLDDPRWLKGEAAREGLVGMWRAPLQTAYQFNADGTCSVWRPHSEKATGTYHHTDDGQVELTVREDSIFKDGAKGPEQRTNLKVRVNQDEMLVIDLRFPEHSSTLKRAK
jgi:hypothetical protein